MISEEAIDKLENLLYTTVNPVESSMSSLRSRFQLIDRYLQKESALQDESIKGQIANQLGDKRKISDPEIAISKIQHETGLAFMAGTFLNSSPIFPAVANKENEAAAEQMTALSKRDEIRMDWGGNLMEAFDDVLKFNVCAVETGWTTKRASLIKTSADSTDQGSGEVRPIIYEGNQIKRLDPYNLFLDPSVRPFENHKKGGFAGYIERLNYITLKEEFNTWPQSYIIRKNVKRAFNSNPGNSQYHYIPIIRKLSLINEPQGWAHWWGNETTVRMTDANGIYDKFVLYKKIIPKEWKITVPRGGTPQLFKFIYINSILLYAEPLNEGHEFLPIVCGQMYPGTLDVKSFVEMVMDLQDMSTSAMHGMLDSFRRSVYDRALYDPTRINKKDIDSVNPVSKIPVQTNLHQQKITDAYYQIPYENRDLASFGQLFQMGFNLANQTTGQNPSSQGAFIKGNKTLDEFQTIMSNSQARIKLGAMRLAQNFLAPLKEILKINYLVNAVNQTINDHQAQQQIEIDPQLLRDVAPDFIIGDGIMPTTKVMDTEMLMQAFQTMIQVPQIGEEYDVAGMFVSILRQQGVVGLNDYKRSPQQIQQIRQQQAAQTQQSGNNQQGGQNNAQPQQQAPNGQPSQGQ